MNFSLSSTLIIIFIALSAMPMYAQKEMIQSEESTILEHTNPTENQAVYAELEDVKRQIETLSTEQNQQMRDFATNTIQSVNLYSTLITVVFSVAAIIGGLTGYVFQTRVKSIEQSAGQSANDMKQLVANASEIEKALLSRKELVDKRLGELDEIYNGIIEKQKQIKSTKSQGSNEASLFRAGKVFEETK